jgi:hypothetical protein
VVNKKNSTARVYLKVSGGLSSLNNVPICMYIRANNVWYSANAIGKATTTIKQANKDSADMYFTVNFNSNVLVDFYAVIDPDNTITESNESNNRVPATGTSP